jgi:hypothetical protein
VFLIFQDKMTSESCHIQRNIEGRWRGRVEGEGGGEGEGRWRCEGERGRETK